MGVVYKARDRRLGRVVALKRLSENLREHPRAAELFLREARAAAALNHPNIVTVYDADLEDDTLFITMELLDGDPIHRLLRRNGRMHLEEVARIGKQVCAGLAYAHMRGVIHRDIKTANLFLTTDRRTKIMDFGLARIAEEVRRSTSLLGGTPNYMAPEQAHGTGGDQRADLYSLGATLFELTTGEVPFPEHREEADGSSRTPPDPREIVSETDPRLAALIRELLAIDPADRPESAAHVGLTPRGDLLGHPDPVGPPASRSTGAGSHHLGFTETGTGPDDSANASSDSTLVSISKKTASPSGGETLDLDPKSGLNLDYSHGVHITPVGVEAHGFDVVALALDRASRDAITKEPRAENPTRRLEARSLARTHPGPNSRPRGRPHKSPIECLNQLSFEPRVEHIARARIEEPDEIVKTTGLGLLGAEEILLDDGSRDGDPQQIPTRALHMSRQHGAVTAIESSGIATRGIFESNQRRARCRIL